jgi:hypothetical protein
MKRVTYKVQIGLTFADLTLEDAHNLEVFMEGLTARDDWGTPIVVWGLYPTGEKESKGPKKSMTAKKLLDIEKESGASTAGSKK